MEKEKIIEKNSAVESALSVKNFLERLRKRSRNDPKAVFIGLYKQLLWSNLLKYAALEVLNHQAYLSEINDVTKEIFLRTFDQQIADIKQDVAKGINPLAVKKNHALKSEKFDKGLSDIPILKDKVIQEAIRMILEAIYEPTFKRNPMGLGCEFSTQDALKNCLAYMHPNKKMQYVLKLDIKKFFGNVDHEILHKILGEKIHDRKFRTTIWRIMKAETYKNGQCSGKGLFKECIVSSLLAHIYIHKFDEFIESLTTEREIKEGEESSGTIGYIRYADNGVILWNGKISELYNIKQKCKDFLWDRLKLELSDEKTTISDLEKGFQFVGFYFVRKRTMNSQKGVGEFVKNAVALAPKTSLHNLKEKITKICRISTVKGYDESYTILKLNQILDECYNYFKHTSFPSSVNNCIFSHAILQYRYYLKRKGFIHQEAKKLFWKPIGGRKTWTFKGYFIRVPPLVEKRNIYENQFPPD